MSILGKNREQKLSGLYTAVVTPFLSNSVDYFQFEALLERQMKARVNGLVVLGSTGEPATLSKDEKIAVIQSAVTCVGDRTAVIVGTGASSTVETIENSQIAQKEGADAVLVITPYGNKPSQKGLVAHFSAVADNIDVPLIMYNIPGRTGVYMEPDTVIELSTHANIVGIKDASSQFEDMQKIINNSPADFSLLSGNDGETLRIMQLGGDGVIAVSSNVIAQQMREFIDICQAQNWKGAEWLQEKYEPFFQHLFIETNPLPAKTIMAHEGMCDEEFRLPLTPMYDDTREELLTFWDGFKRSL